jgi:two-component system, OmpR family, sensor kinase
VTLRLRLVAALVGLTAAGLTVFGVVTYGLYARSQYDRLDDDIRATVRQVAPALSEEAGLGDQGDLGGRLRPGPRARLPLGTYAALVGPDRTVVARLAATGGDVPDLPDDLPTHRLFGTGSVDGSTRWRVLARPDPVLPGYTVVVAAPTTDVRSSLDRLVLIEVAAAAVVLVLLAGGSWLVLRRGLRPLERMADVAGSITAGTEAGGAGRAVEARGAGDAADAVAAPGTGAAARGLGARVEPADDRSEVGRLGLALNRMLDDLEAAFRQREASEARLRQFLADASHELRTPLTAIRGFAELIRLQEGETGDAGATRPPGGALDRATMVRRIEEESIRMRHLVDDLLLLARLDETRPVRRAPVDLAVLAADACSDAVAADPGRPVTLDAPEPVVVQGDENHLRQAIGNLVTNALRHTPPGTAVEVGAHAVDGRAVVTVRDHGPGLDDEALVRAFDRFWRSGTARAGAGAGLGLSIVAGIAAEHGGVATVANAEGGGAAFAIDLPTGAPPVPARPAA